MKPLTWQRCRYRLRKKACAHILRVFGGGTIKLALVVFAAKFRALILTQSVTEAYTSVLAGVGCTQAE